MEAQLYASKYSREIAGLVVVDPFSPALAAGDYLSSQLIGTQGSLYKNLGFAAHFGLIRLALLSGLHLHPLEISTPLSTLSKSIVDHDFNRCMKFHRNFTDLHSGTYWMDTVRTIQDHSNGLNQLYNNRYNFSFDPRATRGLFSAPVGQSLSENQAWARHQQNMKELLSENTVTVGGSTGRRQCDTCDRSFPRCLHSTWARGPWPIVLRMRRGGYLDSFWDKIDRLGLT